MIQKLKSLVLENRRLIIPSIGAFLVKETEDPQKRIIFSSFLKYDDGLLTKLLCKQENISEEQAKQIVDNFVRDVLNVINNGNNFFIPNFGYFTKSSQGVIDFVIENIDDKIQTGVTEEKKEEPEIPPYVPPYVPPVVETPAFGNTTEQAPLQDFDFSNFYVPPTSNTTDTPPVREKNSHAGYWILTIILIIVAVLLLLYLFSNDFKKTVNSLFSSKPKIEVKKDTTTVVADTTKQVQQQDTVVAKQDEPSQQTNPVSTTSSGTPNGKYQVIAGCYLERRIAENFADELRGKGYNVRIPDGLAGEWTLVIIFESNDRDEAEQVKDSFAAEGYPDAWVRTKVGYSETASRQTSSYSNTSSTTKTTNTSSTTSNARGRYQAIAGCYLERSNAERYADELRSKGFNVVMPDRLMGEWTILILCESDDWDEVNKVKEQCIAAGYDAWIRTR
ncbi:MAG: SPOR domain-containing protein [Prevotellaceae bacterium]|jgi:cell division septation protein DedD|nr:SPOR domain-containing protein [Prevotellaceae bacterium]